MNANSDNKRLRPLSLALAAFFLSGYDAKSATAPPPSSPPLYAPGTDALARASTLSTAAAAQNALAERCRRLIAAGTPRAQMPPECIPFLAPASDTASFKPLFTYVPLVIPAGTLLARPSATPPTAAPSSSVPPGPSPADIRKRCNDLRDRGTPLSQLPTVCQQFFGTNAGTPLCPDPTVYTHVRLIPCPAPPPPGTNQRPSGNPPVTPPSSTPTRPPGTATPPPQPPSVGQRPPAPPTPPPPPAPSVPPALPPELPPSPVPPVVQPPAPVLPPSPPAPVVRAPASQIPTGGGGAAVSPLSLPPPRPPVASTASPPAAASPAVDNQEFEPGEVIVFAPYAQTAQGALDVIARAGGTVLLQDSLTALDALLIRVRANDGDAPRLAQILRAQLPQASVDLHSRLFLFPLSGTGSTGSAPRHYARAMLQLPAKPAPLLREVRVGVIDSGVERVSALSSGVAGERSFLPNEASPADSVHGTAVASLIAGQDESTGFAGAAPGAKLYIARAMSNLPDGRSYTNAVSVLQALNWLLSEQVPIVNMSLGGKGDSTLALGIAQAIEKGLIVVAAAGNSGPTGSASFPAALPNVIAVTAVDVESSIYAQANRGEYVMISAPGVDVWAPQGASGRYVSGTSFASAWVSGALALVASQSKTANRATWSQALCRSAKDLGRSGRDTDFGCGLLQVAAFAAAIGN